MLNSGAQWLFQLTFQIPADPNQSVLLQFLPQDCPILKSDSSEGVNFLEEQLWH